MTVRVVAPAIAYKPDQMKPDHFIVRHGAKSQQ